MRNMKSALVTAVGVAMVSLMLAATPTLAAPGDNGETCGTNGSCNSGNCVIPASGGLGTCQPNNAPEIPIILMPLFLLAAAKVAHSSRKRALKKKAAGQNLPI